MTSLAIRLDGVEFSFGAAAVLKNVTWELPRGEFVAMVGPNGGGKSTLVKVILGLLPHSAGRVRLLDDDPRRAARRCGYVPQSTETNRTFPITVADVLLMGAPAAERRSPFPTRETRRRVDKRLDEFGLTELKHSRIGELSMGQRKRVLVARALMSDPEILFLDEPGASMDIESEKKLFDLLKEMTARTTIVLVTHDIGVISHYVTGVACVNGGLCYHPGAEMTREMLELAYGSDAEVLVHGLPGRLLGPHAAHDHHH